MHSIEIHPTINQIIAIFYRIGIWHRGDSLTIKEFRIKLFYSVCYSLFFVSLAVKAITKENWDDECVFVAQTTIIVLVLLAKIFLFIWKEKQIEELLNRICIFSVRDDDDFDFYNSKLKGFVRFTIVSFIIIFVVLFTEFMIFPFVGNEKTIFLKVAFPLDYENDEIAFWIVHIYVSCQGLLLWIGIAATIIILYLMMHCSIRFQLLGRELKKTGRIEMERKRKVSENEKHQIYMQDLTTSVDAHLDLTG